MVKRIQEIEEYYESDDDDPLSIFVAPTYYDTDEQLVIIACLLLLQQRYMLLQSMTLSNIIDEIEDICSSLYTELSDTAYDKSSRHIEEYFNELLDDYSIPRGLYVNVDTSMLDIMDDSLEALVNQLRDEIKVKSKFFKDNLSKDNFNILPNFKRAVQKLCDAVGNNLIYGKEKSKRNVYDFVYGEDKLYKWLTANDDRVCAWCRMQESLPPRTLAEIPLDHPRGRCELEPIDYTYSDDYYLMLARGEYSPEIEAYAPSDYTRLGDY